MDGAVTAGHQSVRVKHNMQVPEDHAVARELGQMILTALQNNLHFISAALPLKIFPPLFNRYEGGQSFGNHIDNAARHVGGTPHRVRTDLSATLFLSRPEDYDGGELMVEDTYGVHKVKLPAGHLILYPASSLHHVTPVTRGSRLASFFWIQSMVRDEGARTLLFDLDTAIQQIDRDARRATHSPKQFHQRSRFYSNPSAPAMIAAAPGQNVFVNRYTGEASVGGIAATRQFFRFATDWHRYVGAAGDSRPLGKAITGASNLVFLFIVVSGIYIWWPRTWTRPSLRAITWFKGGLKGKARDFNWHNVFGFWTAIPLFLVVLSATVISYPWASNMVYKLSGSPVPVRNQPRPAQANTGGERAAAPVLDLAQADVLLARVEQQVPDWRTINLRLPTATDKQVTFAIDTSFGGQPQKRSTIVFDKATGEIARTQTFADGTAGERTRSWMRFVHTGEFYGVAGQTIAGVASAAGAVLVFTGLSLAVRRLWGWKGRRSRAPQGVPKGTASFSN